MYEMRKEKRWPVNLYLEISTLFRQDNQQIKNVNASIEVFDISKSGIGFRSKATLPLGYYFNAQIVLMENDALNCVIRIIRQQKAENGWIYGCEIVQTSSVMEYVINEYAASLTGGGNG